MADKKKKFLARAIKRPGSLREHFGIEKGNKIPKPKAQAELSRLQKKAKGDKKLSESELRLFKKLNLFLKVLSK